MTHDANEPLAMPRDPATDGARGRARSARRRWPGALALAAWSTAAIVGIAGWHASAGAQAAPGASAPITLVLGFPAGSGIDVVARLLQPSLEQSLGTRIVFEYRPGAGGNVASEFVARARPDGHTLLFGTAATHGINAAIYKRLPFDVEADFTPIAPIVDVSNVLTVNPQVIDVTDVQQFIERVRAAPGRYNYASTGNGTGTHLAFAEFNSKARLEMVHVPYKGGPEALQAVLKGEVCCIMNQVQTVLAQYRAGKVRLLGVTTAQRVNAVPEVPTISESGLPGFENFTWFALFGPKGMDAATTERIGLAVKRALEEPSVRQKLVESGNTPHWETPAQFRATVKANRAKWAEVVRESGASVD